jgi:hypothetical protein
MDAAPADLYLRASFAPAGAYILIAMSVVRVPAR